MNERGETRAGKYGRFLGTWANITINLAILELERADYIIRLIDEIKTYSFEPRKRGEPKSSGCVWELENLQNFLPQDPEYLARLIKEGIHLMYQKQTQKKVLDSLLNELELSQPK